MVDVCEPVAPSATCRAPHVALRFSPNGQIHACCVNDQYPLGRVGEQTIAEVWQGERLQQLRSTLDANDYSLGCDDCGTDITDGHRLQTHAEQFDRYPQPMTALEWPKRVEFALSNTCNLQCIQCNGDLSSSIRAQREHRPPLESRYGDAFFDELREVLPHVEVAVFIGGEPFLARECRRVWDLLIEMELSPEVHVTTNGTVWNDQVERYLHALRMNVAVSIDGVEASTVEQIRVGAAFEDLLRNRDRFLAATRSYGSGFSLNHCLMTHNWPELGAFLLDADRLDVTAHVIPVVYPASMSLYRLPKEELGAVLAALEAEDARIRGQLDRNASAWDGTLEHLRHAAADASRTVHEVAVTVAPRGASPTGGLPCVAQSDATRALIRTELEAWGGRPALVMELDDAYVVRSVDSPSWAGLFDADGWVGLSLDDVSRAIAPVLGEPQDAVTDTDPRGWLDQRYHYVVNGRPVPFRSVVTDWGIFSVSSEALDDVAVASPGRSPLDHGQH